MSLHDAILAKALGGNSGGSGGSASIDVTASVGQTIVVEEVDANGKPTKWKAADFQEKICGTEMGYVLPETTVNYETGENAEGIAIDSLLVKGNTYVVNWDGVNYNCVCYAVEDDITMFVIGNYIDVDGETDTGEPFSIATAEMDGVKVCHAMPLDESVTAFTFSIKCEVAIPIPVEYVSNAFPYYIDVTGSGTDEDPYAVKETVMELTAIFNSGREMVARTPFLLSPGAYMVYRLFTYGTHYNGYGMSFYFTTNAGTERENSYVALTPLEDGSFAVAIGQSVFSDS